MSKSKPNIFKLGNWFCSSVEAPKLGIGNSPKTAYIEWFNLNRQYFIKYPTLCSLGIAKLLRIQHETEN
jgi:hypothetical protein